MRFVYYANYLVYFEMARTGMLRESGTPYSSLEARGVLLPVMVAHCDYGQPARYEDLLAIDVDFPPFKGVRFRLNYKVWRVESATAPQSEEEELLLEGYTEHVCMSPEGKVLRPDPAFVQLVRH